MTFIANAIRLLSAPVFFVLAWLNYVLNNAASAMNDMPGMAMPQAGATLYGVHLGPQVVNAIGSWWLMYLLMGIGCLPAWLGLFSPKPKRSAPVRTGAFSD